MSAAAPTAPTPTSATPSTTPLLGQLERLGAVSITDDVARLEPLGVRAVRSKLDRDDLFVPLLPAPDKMTADDLVLVLMHGSDDDLEAELASWTDSRTRHPPAEPPAVPDRR